VDMIGVWLLEAGLFAVLAILAWSQHRWLSLRSVARSAGLVPVAYARRESAVVGIWPSDRTELGSPERRFREDPSGARLVLHRDGILEPIESVRVWEMTRNHELWWFPGSRLTGALGFRHFERLVRADPLSHSDALARLNEYHAGEMRVALFSIPPLLVVLVYVWRTYG